MIHFNNYIAMKGSPAKNAILNIEGLSEYKISYSYRRKFEKVVGISFIVLAIRTPKAMLPMILLVMIHIYAKSANKTILE